MVTVAIKGRTYDMGRPTLTLDRVPMRGEWVFVQGSWEIVETVLWEQAKPPEIILRKF